ncbi:hypothetical protein BZA77DRAFT_317331 [Pyronema omphalodes]|nr:hypothetical protein BZA77DRAFT_317331 [Pyronema omphalodes]
MVVMGFICFISAGWLSALPVVIMGLVLGMLVPRLLMGFVVGGEICGLVCLVCLVCLELELGLSLRWFEVGVMVTSVVPVISVMDFSWTSRKVFLELEFLTISVVDTSASSSTCGFL